MLFTLLLFISTFSATAQQKSQSQKIFEDFITHGRTDTTQICRVWGSINGVGLAFAKNQCEEWASVESCTDLYQSLGGLLKTSFEDEKVYVSQNIGDCNVIVKHTKDGVSFMIESLQGQYSKAKQQIDQFMGCWEDAKTCESPFLRQIFNGED